MNGEKLLFRNAGIKTVAFQSGNPELDAQRHYVEMIACQTETPNDQHYLFMPESVPSLIAGYEQGKPLMVNHDHWGVSGLGFGHTIAARYEKPNLIVTAYLSLGKQTPQGPFGSTDELSDAINDGFVKYVSVHGGVVKGTCSISGKPYITRYEGPYTETDDESPYIRGYKYPVVNENGEEVLTVCQVLIEEFDPYELSFVWQPSDDRAQVVNPDVSMAAYTGAPIDIQKRDRLTASRTREPKKQFGGFSMSVDVLTAEKNALQAQVDAKDTEIKNLQASKTALETENADLKAQADANELAIADGKLAREKAVEQNAEAFTKANPDLKEDELKAELQGQKEFAETLSLEKLYANTAGYERQAEKLYKAGRVTQGGATDDDADPDKQGPRPRR